jgi:hypothetical protein
MRKGCSPNAKTFAQKLWKSCGKVGEFLSPISGISCRYDILHKISSAGERAALPVFNLLIINNLKRFNEITTVADLRQN